MLSETSKYYQSHAMLGFIGVGGQSRLGEARVLVIGAGGLGCPCLQYLAGCGIGKIGIADFDTVSLSNLHRQIIYQYDDIGKKKSPTAKERLISHNPNIIIDDYDVLVVETNVLELIEPYDIVVDGTDNFSVRYLINDACVYLGKPLVYGAIYQAEGHVTVFNYNGSATLRCLFPEPQVETYIPSCAEVGAYNIVTGMIGTMMANEIVKIILGNKEVLADKLVSIDALSVEMHTIRYKMQPASRQISNAKFLKKEIATDISTRDFLKLPPGTYQLLDVREEWEREEFDIGGLLIPLHNLPGYDLPDIAKNELIIIYCGQGNRSKSAVQYLRKKGYSHATSLQDGLQAYRQVTG